MEKAVRVADGEHFVESFHSDRAGKRPIERSPRQEMYDLIMEPFDRCEAQNPNRRFIAQMLASRCVGEGALNATLGLEKQAFVELMDHHFQVSGLPLDAINSHHSSDPRFDERDELVQLMTHHRANTDALETVIAEIIAAACMGADHLWQDLGLWSRNQLSAMMEHNFPSLAAKNDKNMKWKKFLYKQLCIAEGIYICRAPSCEVCADYKVCFGPED